jgi:SAM-dependent methyltransferase
MMTNDDVYAGGLLNRALDPATQPPEVRAFLAAEIDLLLALAAPGTRVVDIGCGTGRHLDLLGDRVALGLGVDYQHSYLVEAHARARGRPLHFVAADAAAVPVDAAFDLAICTTNSWGTMADKAGVLGEMRRLTPGSGRRFLCVYTEGSVAARGEWYRRLGHEITAVTDEFIETEGGFRSEHFSDARLRSLVGPCDVRPLAGIAYAVTF